MSLEIAIMMGAILSMVMVIAARVITLQLLTRAREDLWQLHGEAQKRFNEYRRQRSLRELVEQEQLALHRKKITLQKKLILLEKEIENWVPERPEHEIHYVLFKEGVEAAWEEGAQRFARQA